MKTEDEGLPFARPRVYVRIMHQFRRLEVWHEAVDLASRVYQLTADYPPGERYGLTAQMRRAAVSVSTNIAEGVGRGSSGDVARFLRMAISPICELESQVEVSRKLGMASQMEELVSDLNRLKARIKTLEPASSYPILDTSYLLVPHLP